jgi:hypothetical protein
VAVNPDKLLEAVARERGWPIVTFHGKTRRVVKRVTTAVGATAVAGGAFAAGVAFAERRRPA